WRGCSPAFGSSFFGSIANTSLQPAFLSLSHAPQSHNGRSNRRDDLWFAAHYARRISFPDMDGRIAAIRTPTVESLLQSAMRNHGFVFAQGLAQDQITFRPMVVTGGGAHQNIS